MMPELPEVETIATYLDRELRGVTLDRVIVRRKDMIHGDPRPLSRVLLGRTVRRVRRRAKRVIVDLGAHLELVFHLGMSGRLLLVNSYDALEKHTHLRIALSDQERELRFIDPRRFGGVWCLGENQRHVGRKLGAVGREPLELSLRDFRSILSRCRQIKALLLDQHAIAGLGNIYCDEALHDARIHPLTQAGDLTPEQSVQLLRAIKKVLRHAIRCGGSTSMDYRQADGRRGSFQDHHRVYGREGKACRRCGAVIVRIQAAGRSTHLCASCQKT